MSGPRDVPNGGRRALRGVWPVLLVPVITILAASRLGNAGETLSQLSISEAPILGLSVAAMAGTIGGIGWLWSRIVRALAPGPVSEWSLLRFFLLSWPARYIPGTVPYHAARIAFAERLGVTRRMVAASLAYEGLFQVGVATLVGIVAVVLALGVEDAVQGKYLLLLSPLVLLPAFAHPAVLTPSINRLLVVVRREPIPESAFLPGRRALAIGCGYGLAYCLNGASFFLVVAAFTDQPNLLLAIGAYNLAGAAGIAVIFLPSGIGVREVVIVALLSSSIPAESALVIAGTARALSVIADFAPIALLGMWELCLSGKRSIRRPRGLGELPRS